MMLAFWISSGSLILFILIIAYVLWVGAKHISTGLFGLGFLSLLMLAMFIYISMTTRYQQLKHPDHKEKYELIKEPIYRRVE